MMYEGEVGGEFSEGLLWQTQSSWANLTFNSDNLGYGEEKKLGKEVTSVIEISAGGHNQKQAAVPPTPAPGKKRKGGGGGVGKNGMKKGSTNTGDKGKGVAGADHDEMHIWTERERRRKMRNMFANLHALLPQLPAKADKSTIVDEAVSYIKTLQQTLQKLQKQKVERLQGAITINLDLDPSSVLTPQDVAFDSREAFLANHGSASNLATAATTPISNPSNSLTFASHFAPVSFQTWTSPNVVANICGEEAHISMCTPKKPGLFSAICFLLEKYKIGVISAHITSDCNRSMYMIHTHARGAPDQFLEAFPAIEIFKQALAEIMLVVEAC